jgi:hypothetical protein
MVLEKDEKNSLHLNYPRKFLILLIASWMNNKLNIWIVLQKSFVKKISNMIDNLYLEDEKSWSRSVKRNLKMKKGNDNCNNENVLNK